MNETTYTIAVSRNDLYAALVDFEKRCDNQQAYHAVRVSSDGKVYVTTDAGWNCSEDEYFHRMPHTVTVKRAAGAGQCNLPDDWSDDDGDLIDEVESCVKSLEEAGYEVELA